MVGSGRSTTAIRTAAGRTGCSRATISSILSVPGSPEAGTMFGSKQAGRHVEAELRPGAGEEIRRADSDRTALQDRLVQSAALTCSASAMAKNSPAELDAEHRLAIDHPLLTHVNQIVVERAGDLGPEIGADMQVWRQPAVPGLLEAQPVRGIAGDPVVDIGAEAEHAMVVLAVLLHLDRHERRVVDADADLLHGRDEEMLVALALQDRREQADQRSDARLACPCRTKYRRKRFGCRDRRKTADSTDAPEAGPSWRLRHWRHFWRRQSAPQDLDRRSALGSPWFALTLSFARMCLARLVQVYVVIGCAVPPRISPVWRSPLRDALHNPKPIRWG